ncbi:hypothetical protein [Caudoviricetes sp.]|nr:hypothetical protein [Caudoviricetes sp.]UOF81538.1 hypothetical protein [Caudoviricetes sp.]
MSKATDVAQKWVELMVSRETRKPGDTVNAMRRLSERYKIPYSLLFALKYRPPKDLWVSEYEKLEAAYHDSIRRAVTALDHERKLTQAKTGFGARIIAAVNALDREDV